MKTVIFSQCDAILHFFIKLDISLINELLDANRTYADLEKPMFIYKLGNAFDQANVHPQARKCF